MNWITLQLCSICVKINLLLQIIFASKQIQKYHYIHK